MVNVFHSELTEHLGPKFVSEFRFALDSLFFSSNILELWNINTIHPKWKAVTLSDMMTNKTCVSICSLTMGISLLEPFHKQPYIICTVACSVRNDAF